MLKLLAKYSDVISSYKLGKEDVVEPSFDRTLDQVLNVVRSRLSKINDMPPAKR
ncbi:MAG: hypothetical protein Q7J31_18385 [Syntrophales bacterium]|nr:hypothetical protein [Syntrophales bacterium]